MPEAVRKSSSDPTPNRRDLQLFGRFLFLSAGSIVAIMLLVGFGLNDVFKNNVIVEAERDAVNITAALRDCEVKKYLKVDVKGQAGLSITPEEIPQLDRELRAFLSQFNVVKIKVFDKDTRIIYSTDHKIIGELDKNNNNLKAALSGRSVSRLEDKDSIWDLANEERFDVELVESYVPVRHHDGRIVGSMEIYKDVSAELGLADSTLFNSVGILLVVLLAVFSVLCGMMHRASQAMRSHTAALEESQEALRATRDLAEDASRAKSEFLANMSHEIRTPMTAILGYAEVLHEDISCCTECPRHTTCELRIKSEERIQTIMRNGKHLLQLINDILDLSKVDAGRLELESLSCSPLQVVADVAGMMRVRADAKGLELHAEFRGLIPEAIQSDPTRLRQILVNLVGNAVKFTETGSVRLVTSVSGLGSDNPIMQFEVIDTGMGIAAGQLATLFQPFVQADTSTTRKFGGSGLGLAISKRLAERLGGDLTVESCPGRGSLFRVTVTTGPLGGVKMIADPSSATILDAEGAVGFDPRGATQAEASGSSKLDCRILLAEDAPDNQRLISHILKKAGAEVTVVEDGKQAVQAALGALHGRRADDPERVFDVILMDIQMPVMDGYAATRQLRGKGYEGPIIALTAHAMAGDRDKCLRAGCDDFAGKPIIRADLLEMILQYTEAPTEAAT